LFMVDLKSTRVTVNNKVERMPQKCPGLIGGYTQTYCLERLRQIKKRRRPYYHSPVRDSNRQQFEQTQGRIKLSEKISFVFLNTI
jgi:hypothetical protein